VPHEPIVAISRLLLATIVLLSGALFTARRHLGLAAALCGFALCCIAYAALEMTGHL
jgi:hypothetical protein